MDPNTITLNTLTLSLIALISVRLLGVIVFFDLWGKKREAKYLLLLFGWLLVTLGTVWGLYTHLTMDEMDHFVFSFLSGLGTFWIGCGILAYIKDIDPDFIKFGKQFMMIGSGLIIAYGLIPVFGINIGPSPGVIVQLFIALIVTFAAVFKRRTFINLTRSSYTWLVILAILTVLLTLAFGVGLIGPQQLPLGFTGTTIVHFVAIIFFLHLEFNLTNRQLKISEQRFMRLAENAQDLIYRYEIKPQPGFTYVSPGATTITGYTPAEHYADPELGFKLVHPEDRHLLDAMSQGNLIKGQFLTLRWIKKDGSTIWCEQRNVPIFDDEGNLVAIEGIARDITSERKASQQYEFLFKEMLEGFALHEIILDSQNIPIDYRFITVNPAFTRLTGLKETDLVGHTVMEVMPDTEPYWIETFGRVALTGDSVQFIHHSRALEKYYEVAAFKAAPNQFAAIFSDVTQRVHTEEQLRESEEKFRLLVEKQNDLIVKVDPDGKFLYVSPSYCKMFGKSEDELLGKKFMPLIHEDDLPSTMKAMEDLYQPPHSCYIEQRAMTKEGWKWLAWNDVAILDNTGRIIEIIGHGVDITDRKQAEKALHHSHDLLRYIIEYNKSAVAVHDRNLNYIYVSQRYLDDYGVEDQDIMGKHHYDVFPDLPEKWRVVHQKALEGEVSSAEEDIFERADGSVEWTRWECRPWYEADGSIGGIILYTEVITERKKVDDELRRLKNNLVIEVQEKTQELQERIAELERYRDATIKREFRMKELRDEIKRLKGI